MAKIMVRIIATVQTRGDSEITGVKTVWLSHWAWLVLGWKTDLQKRLLRDKQFKDKRGNAIKAPMESLVPDLSKITKAERIEEIGLIHVWLYFCYLLKITHKTF
jgi:hypothetical protein